MKNTAKTNDTGLIGWKHLAAMGFTLKGLAFKSGPL